MGKEIILIRTTLTEGQLQYLRERFEKKYRIIYKPSQNGEALKNPEPNVKVMIVHELTQLEVEKYPNLAYVQIYGRGTDKVCTHLLDEKNIAYRCCKGNALAESVAEYVLLQVLYWERNISKLNNIAHQGNWSWEWRGQFQYRSLQQIKVGIVGKGRIGETVSATLSGLGMYACFINVGQRMMQSDMERIGQMDYITIHLPLNRFTERIIDMDFIRRMKQNAVLINTSRGNIVDENHLLRALKERVIRAASLDVTEKEPIDSVNALAVCDKVLMTPHIAGRTEKALSEIIHEIADNIEQEVWKWKQC